MSGQPRRTWEGVLGATCTERVPPLEKYGRMGLRVAVSIQHRNAVSSGPVPCPPVPLSNTHPVCICNPVGSSCVLWTAQFELASQMPLFDREEAQRLSTLCILCADLPRTYPNSNCPTFSSMLTTSRLFQTLEHSLSILMQPRPAPDFLEWMITRNWLLGPSCYSFPALFLRFCVRSFSPACGAWVFLKCS